MFGRDSVPVTQTVDLDNLLVQPWSRKTPSTARKPRLHRLASPTSAVSHYGVLCSSWAKPPQFLELAFHPFAQDVPSDGEACPPHQCQALAQLPLFRKAFPDLPRKRHPLAPTFWTPPVPCLFLFLSTEHTGSNLCLFSNSLTRL